MPTYGDYESEKEMDADFGEWRIMKQSNEIADEKVAAGSDLPRAAWVIMAAHELKAYYAAASAEFERLYG